MRTAGSSATARRPKKAGMRFVDEAEVIGVQQTEEDFDREHMVYA
jgi:hypothetical protein